MGVERKGSSAGLMRSQEKINLLEQGYKRNISISNQVIGEKLNVIDNQKFITHLNLLIPYAYEPPSRILQRLLSQTENNSLQSIIKELHEKVCKSQNNNDMVWKGNIGEIIAASYIVFLTEYELPYWKLRYSSNLTKSMPGEDIIAFEWNKDGSPKAMLIIEAKNYLGSINAAIKRASQNLLSTKKAGALKSLDFIINQYHGKGKYREALSIEQFLDEYNNPDKKHYLAFIVTDKSLWKDQYFKSTQSQAEISLKITSFLIEDWENQQKQVVPNSSREQPELIFKGIAPQSTYEITQIIKNDSFQVDQKKLSSAALLYDLDIEREYSFLSKINSTKIRNAAKLLFYRSVSPVDGDNEKAKSYAKSAATIFEHLAKLQLKKNKNELAIEYITESAFLYSIAGHNANAKVLSSTIRDRIPLSKLEGIFKDKPYIILLFHLMNGDFSALNNSLAKFIREFPSENNLDNFDISDMETLEQIRSLVERIGDRFIVKSFVNVINFLKSGNCKYAECVEENIQKAQKQFETIGQYERYSDTFIIKHYLKSLIENSSQKWLRKYIQSHHDHWDSYIRHISMIGKFPLTTLWKSQQEALKHGLLTDKSILVSMPTSSGKTKMAEFVLFKNYVENPEKKAVFIVPTRALASEVENDLSINLSKLNIKIAVIYGGYNSSPTDKVYIDHHNIFVLTPEKLDFLLRNEEDFQSKISLIIIDEVHEAAKHSTRGLRIEFIFSRILHIARKHKIRIIALSAVIKNPADFSQWITQSRKNHINIDWRPTYKKFGCFSLDTSYGPIVKYTPIGNEGYLAEEFYIPLPFHKNDIMGNNRKTDNIKIVSLLGSFYARNGETLIFTAKKSAVEKIVQHLIELKSKNQGNKPKIVTDGLEEVINACKIVLPENHLLIKSLQYRIGYHHADLPDKIKKEIENALRKNIINLIVSTTTLAQGVNLPLKNIIIYSLKRGNEYISSYESLNIIGRAGRAGIETEGHIIFCNKDDFEYFRNQSEKSKSFIVSGLESLIKTRFPSIQIEENFLKKFALASTLQYYRKEYIPQNLSQKQFEKLLDNIQDESKQYFIKRTCYNKIYKGTYYLDKKLTPDSKNKLEEILSEIAYDLGETQKNNAGSKKVEILDCLDSQLIAWIIESAIEEISDEFIDTIFQNLLCNVQQIENIEYFQNLKSEIKNRAINIIQKPITKKKRQLFYQTGLSYQSNEKLHELAKSLAENMQDYERIDNLPRNIWEKIFENFSKLSEFHEISKEDVDVFLAWLDGKGYDEITNEFPGSKIEEIVKKIEKIKYALPWGLNAIYQHLKYLSGDIIIANIFSSLPSMVMYGVPNIVAVYSMEFGFDDRKIAKVFGEIYTDTILGYEGFINKMWSGFSQQEWYETFQNIEVEQVRLEAVYNNINSNIQEFFEEQKQKQEEKFNLKENFPENLDELFLDLVEIDGTLYLTDYVSFWELSGEKIEEFTQMYKDKKLIEITDISFQNKSVSLRVI